MEASFESSLFLSQSNNGQAQLRRLDMMALDLLRKMLSLRSVLHQVEQALLPVSE